MFLIAYYTLQSKRIELDVFGKVEASPKKNVDFKNSKENVLLDVSNISKSKIAHVFKKRVLSKKEIYFLISKKSSITMSGDIKIQSGHYGLLPDGLGTYAFVRSSQCPDNKYSIVRIDKNGVIESELDCQFASIEDIITRSGVTQWNIDKKEPKVGEYNFALLGPGQFLVLCPHSGFQLTRRGHFILQAGLLRDDQGCFLYHNGDKLNPQGGPITLNNSQDELQKNGCFENSKQCIAQIDLQDPIIQNITYKNAKNLLVNFEGNLKNTTRSSVLSNALEQLDTNLRGPTGIGNWDYIESLDFPINCDENSPK